MSDANDRELGMNRSITRRDFLNGMAIGLGAVAGSGLPHELLAAQAADQARAPARMSSIWPMARPMPSAMPIWIS